MATSEPVGQTESVPIPTAAVTKIRLVDHKDSADPFDPASLRIDARSSDAALGVERPLLVVPVQKPSKQAFFRVHPGLEMRLDAAVIELDVERETYLVTPDIARLLPGETKQVRLLTCLARTGGSHSGHRRVRA